jgi:hypothetical protein
MPDIAVLMTEKLNEEEQELLLKDIFSLSREEVRDMKRQLNVKLEALMKDGKPSRGVIDEGFVLLTINAVVGWVFEDVLFHQIATDISIKGAAKDKVMRDFSERANAKFKDRKACAVEIDQTGMEVHERFEKESGVMNDILTILNYIAKIAATYTRDTMSFAFMERMSVDKLGMKFKVVPKDKNAKPFVIPFKAWFMASGWRLTSAVNFVNELAATLSAFTANPQHIWDQIDGKDPERPTLLEMGMHKYLFVPAPELGLSSKICIYIKVEGDDVGGLVNAILMAKKDIITKNFNEQGYEVKIKFVENGRLECVGLHCAVEDGVLSKDWIPDVMRALLKCGAYTSTALDQPLAMTSRFFSLSMMFARTIPVMSQLMHSLGCSWQSTLAKESVATLDRYNDNKLFIEMGDVEAGRTRYRKEPLVELEHTVDRAMNACTTDVATVAKLVSMSIEDVVSVDEINTWQSATQTVTRETHGSEYILSLPRAIRRKILCRYPRFDG